MKSILLIALTFVLALGLCACGRNKNQETTPVTQPTEPPATTEPAPSETEPLIDPTIMDPTIEPNVPDPSVDDNHLVDPTGGSEGNEGIIPEIKGRLNNMS